MPGPIAKPLLSVFSAAQSPLESASVCSARRTLASLCEACAIAKPSRGQDGNEERGLRDGFGLGDLREPLPGPVAARTQEVKKVSPHVRVLLTSPTVSPLASLTLPVSTGWGLDPDSLRDGDGRAKADTVPTRAPACLLGAHFLSYLLCLPLSRALKTFL